jgi:hypothetical protein
MKINSRLGYYPVTFAELTMMMSFGTVARVVLTILYFKARKEKLSVYSYVVHSS